MASRRALYTGLLSLRRCSAAAAAAAAVASATAAQHAIAPGKPALRSIAAQLASPTPDARRHAIRILSQLTIYLEYHDAVLSAGVLPPLLAAASSAARSAASSNPASAASPASSAASADAAADAADALQCVSDLLKDELACAAAIAEPSLLSSILQLLNPIATNRGGGSSGGGDSGGGDFVRAQVAAARALAELAARPELHDALLTAGAALPLAAAAIASSTAATSAPSQCADVSSAANRNTGGGDVGRAEGKMRGGMETDKMRWLAAACYGLSATVDGARALVAAGALPALLAWARGPDAVAHRYGVGAVARAMRHAGAQSPLQQALLGVGAPKMAVDALSRTSGGSGDPQALCYLAGAVGRGLSSGGALAAALLASGGAQALTGLVAEPARIDTRVDKAGGKAPSLGVAAGVRLCAVRGVAGAVAAGGAGRAAAAAALRAAGAEEALLLAAEGRGSSDALRAAARGSLEAIRDAAVNKNAEN